MSYQPISIKKAMGKINQEWFLPAEQRPFVWANRYGSEKYVCKLFDSIFKGYPIGTILLWTTNDEVPYRKFSSTFRVGDLYENEDKGTWGRHKSLVYDGQQRLQVLYSCLETTVNDRCLVFNLCYDAKEDVDGDTGFRFVDTDECIGTFEIRMNTLWTSSDKYQIRSEYQGRAKDEESKRFIEKNLDKLWDIFLTEQNETALSFYEIGVDKSREEVDEIFHRLNTGGVQLSMADLLFSKIKSISGYEGFEYDVMKKLRDIFGNNQGLSAFDILQVIHIIVKNRTRVDAYKVSQEELVQMYSVWTKGLKHVVENFLSRFLMERFKINDMRIVINKIPIIDLLVFMYNLYTKFNKDYNDLSDEQKKRIDKFFVLAELNDWAMQSYSDHFCEIFKESQSLEFPLEKILDYVSGKGNRYIELYEQSLCDHRWFSLKIILKDKEFKFNNFIGNRFNPELDHIFPIKLEGMDEEYRKQVNVLWNMQPIEGEINNDKKNIHPLAFFKSGKGEGIEKRYDMIPELDNSIWNDYMVFIKYRKKRMIKAMLDLYDISVKSKRK